MSDDGTREENKLKNKQKENGTHDTKESEDGSSDLHKHFVFCKTNPGHAQFVPVHDFNINHLPNGYPDKNIVELIKVLADLTVRVDVKMTSTVRRKFWPDTKVPYAFYDMRGSDVMRTGTGMVWYVDKWTWEDNRGTCQCQKCQHSKTPSKVWGHVWMYTGTQVVFDDIEVRHTTCRLFYDRQDSPLVTLDGWTLVEADIHGDVCYLRCVTCDVDLLDKLDKTRKHWYRVVNKCRKSRVDNKMIVIVSHPHGCPKQVSVGRYINRYVPEDGSTRYTYTTCTCPGSRGAHVQSLEYNNVLYYGYHPHSGDNSDGTNVSGVGRELVL